MTTPTILSDTAAKPHLQRDPISAGGAPVQDQCTVSIPAATATAVNFGLFRIYPGFRLNKLEIINDDLDTGTTVTVSYGWLYDTPTATAVEDNDGLILTNNNLRTAAAVSSWPEDTNRGAAGVTFVAQAFGYITGTIVAGPTTTTGNVFAKADFDYGARLTR